MRSLLLTLSLMLLGCNAWAGPNCEGPRVGEVSGGGVVTVGDLVIRFQPASNALSVGEVMLLDVWMETRAGSPFAGELRFDAEMPLHRHGMNLHPSVSRVAPGHYQVDGVLLHMPGCWSLQFEAIATDGERTRATVLAILE
jgi:hypothetical protein